MSLNFVDRGNVDSFAHLHDCVLFKNAYLPVNDLLILLVRRVEGAIAMWDSAIAL